MHFQYVVLAADVQSPGPGSNMSSSYRVGNVAAGVSHSHMHAIYEKGPWLVLENKKGDKRFTPLDNVRDAEEESAETAAYRAKEAAEMKARAKAQKEEAAA